jgi:steroid 5-alpha reductase family enzyme
MLYERARMPRWLVQLIAVDLVPTLAIFLGCIPLWPALTRGDGALGPVGWLAAALGLFATGLELAADEQRRAHSGASPGALMDVGLWRWCAHPNYLGEILFWPPPGRRDRRGSGGLGVAASGRLRFALSSAGASALGARQRRASPGWAEYAARTPALVPRRPSAERPLARVRS